MKRQKSKKLFSFKIIIKGDNKTNLVKINVDKTLLK